MTEIVNSPDTHHPLSGLNPWPPSQSGQTEDGDVPMARGVKKLYTSVMAILFHALRVNTSPIRTTSTGTLGHRQAAKFECFRVAGTIDGVFE
jgi:hypothetical protein